MTHHNPQKLPYARWWDAMWAVWVLGAVVACAFDKAAMLVPLAVSFFILELPGVRNRADPYLPLTLELQARSPGWLTFLLLGGASWRLAQWVSPDLYVWLLDSWLIWHFIQTYAEKSHESAAEAGSTAEARL